MIKRRYLLLAGLAGLIGIRFAMSSDIDAIVMVLRKRLNYLDLDAAGLRAFARDLVAANQISEIRLRALSAISPLYEQYDSSAQGALPHAIRHGEERIVSDYLLSSDFFANGLDEKRIVHYLGFYDPLKACANPFARRINS